MKRRALLFAGLIAALALPGVGAAQPRAGALAGGLLERVQDSLGADWGPQQNEARAGVRGKRMVPLGRVLSEISRRTPGRVLDAGIEYFGDRPVYRVRWITQDGRRIDYLVDATTGVIMSGG